MGKEKLKISYKEFCESGPYFDIRPGKEIGLDLGECRKKLGKTGKIGVANRYFICIGLGGCEATLHKKGKMIVKGTKKKEEAERIACEIYKKIGID